MAQTTSSSSSIPDYIKEPTKEALSGITDWTKSADNYVYGTKPGESLFTPLAQGQQEAIGNVNWLADQDLADLFGTNKAGGLIDEFAAFDPGKLTDESGYLGQISADMNPYLQQILDPQIREINEALQVGRRDLADSATMSGAFGDARHGVLEGDIYDSAQRNISDVTGNAYKDAWDQAMAIRSGDRDAYTGQNANKATAASAVAGLGQQYKKDFMDVNDALYNSGEAQRSAEEEQRVALENFQTALKDKKYNDAMRILGAIQGAPYTSSTTQKTESDDGLLGLIGAGLGSIFG